MKKIIFISCAIFLSSPFWITEEAFAQTQWQRTIGGTIFEEASSIIPTTDGGYITAGWRGGGGNDMYIVKLDGSVNIQWSKTVGGTNEDYVQSIIQTADDGYAVAGRSFVSGGFDMYIVKLDGSGNLQWSKTIGGVGGTNHDDASSIIQATDGGYISAGWTNSFGAGNSDMYIVKLDVNGALQWSKTVGGTDLDAAHSIIQTTDGGYAVAGLSNSFGAGSLDMYIVKLDGSGNLQWGKTVGGTGLDRAFSIIQTTDGGYISAGWTNSFGAGGSDMYIVKLSSSGTLIWSKTVGGTNNDAGYSIIRTTDGGYAVTGSTNSFGAGNYDMYIVKLDVNGNTCGNSTSPPSQTGTGGVLGTPTPTVMTITPTVTTPSPTVSSGGTVTTICGFVGIEPTSNETPAQFKLEQNYPNPFNPITHLGFRIANFGFVKLTIYDILGREVSTLVNEQLNPDTYVVEWDASNYPSGVYYYQLTAGDASAPLSMTKKMVLVK